METGMYLSALVFGVGIVHLAVQAASFLSSRKRVDLEALQSNVSRDDWYMFFRRSQLTGLNESSDSFNKTQGVQRKKSPRRTQVVQKRVQLRA